MTKIKDNELKDFLPDLLVDWVKNHGVAYLIDHRYIAIFMIDESSGTSLKLKLSDVVDTKTKTILSDEDRIKINGYTCYKKSGINLIVEELVEKTLKENPGAEIIEKTLITKSNLLNYKIDSHNVIRMLHAVKMFESPVEGYDLKAVTEDFIRGKLTVSDLVSFLDLNEIGLLKFLTEEPFRDKVIMSVVESLDDSQRKFTNDYPIWIEFHVLKDVIQPLQNVVRLVMKNNYKKAVTFIHRKDLNSTKTIQKSINRRNFELFLNEKDSVLTIIDGANKHIPFELVESISIGDEVVFVKNDFNPIKTI